MTKLISRSMALTKETAKLFGGRSQHPQRGLHLSPRLQSESDFIVSSTYPAITGFEGLTIPELVWSNLHLKENRVAFECSNTGQKLTYGQIFRQSRGFAAALIQAGLKRGQVVSVVLPNVMEFPAILFGIMDAGGIMSPANPAYTSDEIVRQVVISEATFAVTIPALLPAIREAAKKCPTLKSIIVIGEPQAGCHTFSEMVKVNPAGVNFFKGSEVDTGSAVAILPFSSGTTGPPKGVQLTHRNIVANVRQYITPGCSIIGNVDRGDEAHRLIGVLPFFHSFGFSASIVSGFYTGNHTLCVTRFASDTFLTNLRQIKAHVLTLVPPLISFLANHPQVTREDFKTVECVQSGAAPLGAALIGKVTEKAGKDIFVQNMYGLTETSPAALVLNPKFGNSKIGSCGNVIPNTAVKIIDIDTGKAVGPNSNGELCVKGPQNMKGYYKNDKATREMIDSDGWLHTGDIGYYDEDKCFFVVDRIKELIKVQGLQVAPAELEDLLRRHPGVADVAVIGIPDEKCGEVPRAYVVRSSENLTESHIHHFLKEKVSKHKKLAGGIEFIKVIPKAPSGKILRRELKEKFLQKKRK